MVSESQLPLRQVRYWNRDSFSTQCKNDLVDGEDYLVASGELERAVKFIGSTHAHFKVPRKNRLPISDDVYLIGESLVDVSYVNPNLYPVITITSRNVSGIHIVAGCLNLPHSKTQ